MFYIQEKSECDFTSSVPEGWTCCIHPKGWMYFHNPEIRAVTDQDIRDPFVYRLVRQTTSQYPMDEIKDEMEVLLHVQTCFPCESSTEEVHATALENMFHLAVNHRHCIASYNPLDVQENSILCLDPYTLNRRRRLYWNYLWTHPAHLQSCPSKAVHDAAEAIGWYYTDNLTSGAKSIVPFSKAECEDLSRQIKEMSLPIHEHSVSKTVFLAWLLREVCSFRDAEQYGKFVHKRYSEVCEERLRPAVSATIQPSFPFIHLIINLFFFGIPWTYFAHAKVSFEYRGRLAGLESNWQRYVERLSREYAHFLLVSTVLLSATVAFLAVPDINAEAQVAATISAFTSLGSLIVGVFSIWRHQANTRTADTFTYMRNAQLNFLGLHGHAMLLSLPPVLLIWAILAFAISIVLWTSQAIVEPAQDPFRRGWACLSLISFAVISLPVLLSLYTFSVIWKIQNRRSRTGRVTSRVPV